VAWGKEESAVAQKRALLYAKDFQKKDNKQQEKLEVDAIKAAFRADPVLLDMFWEERMGRVCL